MILSDRLIVNGRFLKKLGWSDPGGFHATINRDTNSVRDTSKLYFEGCF